MKNTILTLFVAIFSSLSLQAQEFKLGLKAGMNFSKLKLDKDVLDAENGAGYQAGLWARLGLGNVHIQPEAYFTTKNSTVQVPKESTPSEFIKGDLKFSNIDVPILIGTKFPLGIADFKLQAGPLFSFVLDQDASYGDNISNTYENALKNYKDSFTSIVVGTGLDILKFSVDLRYEFGLGNISKFEEAGKQKLNLWSISLGYSLF